MEKDRSLVARARQGSKIAARLLLRKYGVRVWTEEELEEYVASARS